MFRVTPVIEPLASVVLATPSSEDVVVEIMRPAKGRLRSRIVVSRSRARGTGRYPSWKMGRMLQWESPHELNGFRLLDADPTVLAFHEQPFVIRFTHSNETHVHYPDVLVERTGGGREVWEIKAAVEAARPETVARTLLLQSALPHSGFGYRMLIGEELKREPRLTNALTLLKYGRHQIDGADRERFRQILSAVSVIRWASAVNGDLGPQGRAVLCRLTLEGFLVFDFEKKLTGMTVFAVSGSESPSGGYCLI